MNKEHFLIELKIYLKALTNQQQAFILNKYETIFEERLVAGETEEQIAKSLDKPRNIAEDILQEFDITIPEKKLERDGWQEIHPIVNNDLHSEYNCQSNEQPHYSSFTRFCQIAGILSLNFLLMFWFIFTVIIMVFASWLVAIILVFSPILGGILVVSGPNDAMMFQLFVSIFLAGAGIIGLLILTPLTKFLGTALRGYLQWNIQVLRGEI